MALKKVSRSNCLYGKELIQEIEENIDEYIFFEFMKSYLELIDQLKDVKDGFKTTPHNLLMDYLLFAIAEKRSEDDQARLGV
tara:strand:+ start:219 stop:464 length:246 start_codon:yes stop_codon:yes gene_type:complete